VPPAEQAAEKVLNVLAARPKVRADHQKMKGCIGMTRAFSEKV
jgi:hypothetical protein